MVMHHLHRVLRIEYTMLLLRKSVWSCVYPLRHSLRRHTQQNQQIIELYDAVHRHALNQYLKSMQHLSA